MTARKHIVPEGYGNADYTTIDRPKFAGDPVTFLQTFIAMRRDPQRALIGFTPQDLDYLGDVWEQALISSLGRDDEFKREMEKFRAMSQRLKAEVMERRRGKEDPPHGCVFEAHDWPTRLVMERAIKSLTAAEIRGIR